VTGGDFLVTVDGTQYSVQCDGDALYVDVATPGESEEGIERCVRFRLVPIVEED
jgi:hypothetical protein